MLENFTALFSLTGDTAWRNKAQALAGFFLSRQRIFPEAASMLQAALALEALTGGVLPATPRLFVTADAKGPPAPEDSVTVSAALFPANARPGEAAELIITLEIKDGWHINAQRVKQA